MAPNSVAGRVLLLSSVWAVFAIALVGYLIIAIYRADAQRSFDSLLAAHLFNLIGAVGVGPDGMLEGDPNLGDLAYARPLSGWYWSVEPIGDSLGPPLRSSSMSGRPVDAPTTAMAPFDSQFRRTYLTPGLDGETLRVAEAEFVMDDSGGVARFRVMGNENEFQAGINAFARQLSIFLGVLGLGTVILNAAAILYGLRPLDRVRKALQAVRTGQSQTLEGSFPSEIAPLVQETNALIANNRRIVERSRTQVGNLAHSLKTPLAVILNEAAGEGGARGETIATQARAMEYQIQHYLQKARIAAQRDSIVFRTPVRPQAEAVVRVMRKLDPGKTIDLVAPPEDIVFAGEREDLDEILGNLLENAAKWGRSAIRVMLEPAGGRGDGARFRICVGDDGPGIPEDRRAAALMRGQRLDEKTPGTGLGLSIVADTAREYGGEISLGASALGGLEVVVTLPRAPT